MKLANNFLFFIINILFSSAAISIIGIIYIAQTMSTKIFNAHPLDENDSYFFCFCFIFWIIYSIIKLSIFSILYKFGRIAPKIHYLLKKCLKNKKLTIFHALKLDFTLILITAFIISFIKEVPILESILFVMGITVLNVGGITSSYLTFFLIDKIIHNLSQQLNLKIFND